MVNIFNCIHFASGSQLALGLAEKVNGHETVDEVDKSGSSIHHGKQKVCPGADWQLLSQEASTTERPMVQRPRPLLLSLFPLMTPYPRLKLRYRYSMHTGRVGLDSTNSWLAGRGLYSNMAYTIHAGGAALCPHPHPVLGGTQMGTFYSSSPRSL